MKTSHLWTGLGVVLAGLLLGVGCEQEAAVLGPLRWPVSRNALETRMQGVLAQAVQDADPDIRCNALETLSYSRGPDSAAAIRQALLDPIPAVRFAAAVAAGTIKDTGAREQLEILLQDSNTSVRLAAGFALERIGDRRFKAWYDKVLMGDDKMLAGQACMLLGKLGNTPQRTDSKAKLWRVMYKKDQAPVVRLQAAEALARLGDPKILRKLLVYAGSGYADDRLIAISGLEYCGGPEAYAMLTVLADDPQIEVRLAAIRALGKRADEKDRNLVRKSVRYTDPQGDAIATTRVRGLAVLALGRVGKPRDAALLYEAMADDNARVRVSAARATIDYLKNN